MSYLGLILLCIYQMLFLIVVFCVKKETREKLYNNENQSKEEKIYKLLSKFVALIMFIVIITNYLSFKSYLVLQIIGLFLYIKGLIGLMYSMLEFNKTEKGELTISGPYKYSRNPQMMFLWTCFLGQSLILCNAIVLMLLIVHGLLTHQYIKLEEKRCLKNYKETYKIYLENTPRYYPFKRRKF